MKKIAAILVLLSFSLTTLAQETPIITCAGQARNATVQDAVAMLRSNVGFNSGILTLEIDATKSPIMSKGYSENSDRITYEATVIGKATIKETGNSRYFASSCTVIFQASTCAILSTSCGGSSTP